jgi:carbamoyl-phosphate synthase large subunit
VLARYGVEMIGANERAIEKAEDRLKFKDAMTAIGLDSAKSGVAHSMEEAWAVQKQHHRPTGGTGFPMVIRPSFTLGGSGGGIAYNPEEFEEICKRGLDLSPTNELLIEESLIGWKEYEMEVVRDKADNCIIVCSIENLDPMGIHTGDSITVAPAQTLTDKEYQLMRNASDRHPARDRRRHRRLERAVLDQPGQRPHDRDRDEPARLAVIGPGLQGDRLPDRQDRRQAGGGLHAGRAAQRHHRWCHAGVFEPSIDYVVTKIPRFAFEKFREADPRLTTQMKSVGEVMAMGRTFQESFQKALRGLETGIDGLTESRPTARRSSRRSARPDRSASSLSADAFRIGMSLDEIFEETAHRPLVPAQIEEIVATEQSTALGHVASLSADSDDLRYLKAQGLLRPRWAGCWAPTSMRCAKRATL